jgi:hypothetical protein
VIRPLYVLNRLTPAAEEKIAPAGERATLREGSA